MLIPIKFALLQPLPHQPPTQESPRHTVHTSIKPHAWMHTCTYRRRPMPRSRALVISLLLLLIGSPTARAETSWQLPTPASSTFSGEWRLLHASIGISAMHMQLLPGDFVLMFDRTDSGPSNLTLAACTAGAVDCTAHSVLLELASNALHPYPLVTNPWCSSAVLLPNGTLLQTGGFSNGDRIARLFSPSSGWVDLPSVLAARRWYATDILLPDTRVLILGGRRQFNFEFFPRDDTPPLTFFPFLDETTEIDAENNLYPFLHLLPDGAVFIFANDRAAVFDPLGRSPLRRLPPIPGGAPRNYPSSGSSVLLPLRPESPTRAEVLLCGGSPRGAYQLALRNGTFLPADRTCGRIVPTEPDPVWSMEEMPMPRVMGDMVLLPTGDVLIINGAAAGTAGWELAREPVMYPILYKPDRPVGSRFEVLTRSNIPRMYHSSATLDTYGRIVVGGSNPHVGYVFANVTYRTELSLEVFLPPYFDPRLDGARPRAVAAQAELGYGETATVRFEVPGGAVAEGPEEVRVAAIAPAFATHSLGMNQRLVALAVGRVAQLGSGVYEAEVVAPPSPEVAPPGYYLWFVVHAGVPSGAVWVRMRPPGAAT